MSGSRATFENRWRIDLSLTTKTQLHIGSGETTTRDNLKNEKKSDKNNELIDILAVTVDNEGRAYIPGSTIKGKLRDYFITLGVADDLVENLLGTHNTKSENAVAGRLEFWDAFVDTNGTSFFSFAEGGEPPYWKSERHTGVAVSVAIDRRTKTAQDNMLYHLEYVPAGITFKLVITGRNLDDNDVASLLQALKGFRFDATLRRSSISLGANNINGWGAFDYNENTLVLQRMDKDQAKDWLKSGAAKVGYDILSPYNIDLLPASRFTPQSKPRVEISLELDFKEPFLVNDPCYTKKDPSGADSISHITLKQVDGKPYIPAKSFRGAFRSQAEKILRTLGDDTVEVDTRLACPAGSQEKCAAVYAMKEVKKLCLACQIFGAPGWRSPVEISDFIVKGDWTKDAQELQQEFLAIDRFTGGGADGKKFNAHAAYKTVLKGSISVDLGRLETAGGADWSLGLLALVMRDLLEGDITFGFGAGKGYGAPKVTINSIKGTALEEVPELEAVLNGLEISGEDVSYSAPDSPNDENKYFVETLLEKLTEKISSLQTEEVVHV